MDHSVQGYLQRLSVKELEGVLHYYLREDQIDNYHDGIRAVLEELRRRAVITELTSGELQALERDKRRLEKSDLGN